MKVISLNNTNTETNTLNLTITEPVTISTILTWNTVKEFAPNLTVDDIVTYDDADLSALSTGAQIGNLTVTDDTVIEIGIFGEHKPQVIPVPLQGKVEVITGGGGLHKSVIIISGVTTVRQALNDRVANAFGKTREALQNMKVHVNDNEATLDSVLKDGDEIALEERKAGTDGASDYLEVTDAYGNVRSYYRKDVPDQSLEDFLIENVMVDFGIADEHEFIDAVDEIDGAELGVVSGSVFNMLLKSRVGNISEVTMAELVFDAPEDEEDCPIEGNGDSEAVVADGVGAAQTIPAEGFLTAGPVMVSQGGTSPIKIMVTSGKTTVKDVVMTSKVLNTFAMTESQMSKMVFNVNDVRSTLDQVLRAGDTLVIEAPKCGTDGNR